MPTEEKRVFYRTSNTYSTLNILNSETKNVWFCCHGLGFLSRYFISYFNQLDPATNYFIAPQAPSKYYQSDDFKYVGASWLTKENTIPEIKNILAYLDSVFEEENIPPDKNLILFGFSQGVSVITRWLASRKIKCKRLIIYAGGIPKELTPEDLSFLGKIKVDLVYGIRDKYIHTTRLNEEIERAEKLFGKEQLTMTSFNGKHEVRPEVLNDLL